MDGTKVLKTFAAMVNMGITEITISSRGYYEIEQELMKWCAYTTDAVGTSTVCGIKINKTDA